jgi:hypothetical protein
LFWVQGAGSGVVVAVLDGKAHQLSLSSRSAAAYGDCDLARPCRSLGEPALQGDFAGPVLRLIGNGGQLGPGPQLQEPEVSSKSGASQLGVGFLEGPKPGKGASLLGSLQLRESAAFTRRAERFDQAGVAGLADRLDIDADRRIARHGDYGHRLDMGNAELHLGKASARSYLWFTVRGGLKAPGFGLHQVADGLRQRAAQGDTRRPQKVAGALIAQAGDGLPILAIENPGILGEQPVRSSRDEPELDASGGIERTRPDLTVGAGRRRTEGRAIGGDVRRTDQGT